MTWTKTPKERVQHFWPEAWCERASLGSSVWCVWRHSSWGPDKIGEGLSPAAAWKDAARKLS